MRRALGRGFVCWLVVLLCLLASGCEKKKPAGATPHVRKALALVKSDPDGALRELGQVQGPESRIVLYAKALAYEAKKDWDKATKALEDAKALAPKDVAVRTSLARVLLVQGKVDAARQEAREANQLAPNDFRAAFLLAVVADSPAQRAEALKALDFWVQHRKPAAKDAEPPAEYSLLRASVERANGKSDRAAQLVRASESAKLGSAGYALTLATFARVLNKPDLALGLAGKIANESSAPAQLVPAANLALELRSPGIVKAALGRLPLYPPTVDVLYLKARHELAENRPLDAATSLRGALKLVPETDLKRRPEMEVKLAEALSRSRQTEEAEAVLKKLLERVPGDVEAELALARVWIQAGRAAEAVPRLKTVVARNPSRRDVAAQLGVAQLAAEDAAGAEQTFRGLVERDRGDTASLRHLVKSLTAQKKYEQAAAELEHAVDAAPSNLKLLETLAIHYLEHKQPEKAISAVQRRTKTAPDPVAATLVLAEVYDKLNRQNEIGSLLKNLTESHPRSVAAHVALSRWYARNGKLDEAVTSQLAALTLDPNSPRLTRELAALYDKAGKKELAAARFEELSRLDPQDVVGLNNAAMIYASDLNRPDRAIALAEQAMKRDPDHPGLADTLGWALLKRGNPKDVEAALPLLARAYRELDQPEVKYHYGAALIRSGKVQAGRALLVEALGGQTGFQGKEEAKVMLAKSEGGAE